MKKICVIGSLNMDMVITTPKIPVLGETVLGSGFMTAPGGKGANQAVAAAKLGGDVAMVGCVGNDIFGNELISNLKTANVDITGIAQLDDTPTGVAMIVVKDGNNFIIVSPGANYKLTPEMIVVAEEMISQCQMIIVQLEIPLPTVEMVLEIARRHEVKVLLNPAPAVKLSHKLLSMIDIITPNETECEIISGMSVKTIDEAKAALKSLQSYGIAQIVVTLGSQGVVYNSGNEIIHKAVPAVKVVDTTAAGDAFTGSLAVALMRGMTIDEAVDFGNMVGTLAVMKKGAQPSLPTLSEVEAFIRASSHKEK